MHQVNDERKLAKKREREYCLALDHIKGHKLKYSHRILKNSQPTNPPEEPIVPFRGIVKKQQNANQFGIFLSGN